MIVALYLKHEQYLFPVYEGDWIGGPWGSAWKLRPYGDLEIKSQPEEWTCCPLHKYIHRGSSNLSISYSILA